MIAGALVQLPPSILEAGDDGQGARDLTRSVRVGGRSRTYLLHVPAGSTSEPRPLVLVFHGGASNAAATERLTGFNDLANREDFLVAYPNGSGRLAAVLTWNAGRCCGYAVENRIDDVAFVRAILDDIGAVARVDAARVYATGISNGGQMSYRLAVDMPDRIAAVAPVAGSLEVEAPAAQTPVSVVHFHGTNDENLPMAGGRGTRGVAGVSFTSVAASLAPWVKAGGCKPEPAVERLPDRARDGTSVERRSYPGCKPGIEVVLYVIEGGGHSWPGRPARERLLGVATRQISATEVMWQHFRDKKAGAGR
jgi:polyhydroxybutyrate depolymerase